MPFALRGSRLAVLAAAVVLLATIPMSALPLLHGFNDDATCSPGATEHDAAAHHMSAGTAPAGEPHCSICHWWQSVGRFRKPSLPSTLAPFVDIGLVATSSAVTPGLHETSSRPARAPPVS